MRENVKVELDKTDTLIINALLENSRLSFRKIADKIGLSPATVVNRVKALEKAGVVKKYSALVDYDLIGYELQALIQIRIAKGKLRSVEEKISVEKGVQAVYDVTGDFDTAVLVKFRTRKGLDGFVKKIQTFDFVERSQTKLILNTIMEEMPVL